MQTGEYNNAVHQFADAVYRFILKNVRDEEMARDIVQDSFERLWVNVDSIAFEKAKSYLFTTAYHRMIDIIRKDKRQKVWEGQHAFDELHEQHPFDVGEILDRAVKLLPNDQRSVLLLRDYEGYSYNEIAEVTGLSEAQVKVYIYRARVFLKKYIGKPEMIV